MILMMMLSMMLLFDDVDNDGYLDDDVDDDVNVADVDDDDYVEDGDLYETSIHGMPSSLSPS